ncbi:MAG: EFR1 family ferrodoxin [Muribaculum sp.]|nr:EFR1 family ferrodoxin [Muribaculum sp.]
MIFCFSGTGNSRHVARRLAELLGQEIVEMNHLTFAEAQAMPIADDLTIWAFPIHSWGLPDFVVKFIGRVGTECRMPCPGRHYMVCTCGDDIGLAHKQWRRLMAQKGWNAMATYSVQMPNTYVLLPGFDVDSKKVVKEKLNACDSRVEAIAAKIAEGSMTDDVVDGMLPGLKSKLIYPLFMRRMISAKPFASDADRCVGCGRCASVCPLGNVVLDDERRPKWGGHCTLCLGCYHVCPTDAVGYGRQTRGKGRYFCPDF